ARVRPEGGGAAKILPLDLRDADRTASILESFQLLVCDATRQLHPAGKRDVDDGHELAGLTAGTLHQPDGVELLTVGDAVFVHERRFPRFAWPEHRLSRAIETGLGHRAASVFPWTEVAQHLPGGHGVFELATGFRVVAAERHPARNELDEC